MVATHNGTSACAFGVDGGTMKHPLNPFVDLDIRISLWPTQFGTGWFGQIYCRDQYDSVIESGYWPVGQDLPPLF